MRAGGPPPHHDGDLLVLGFGHEVVLGADFRFGV
jgi:hypothetical protein